MEKLECPICGKRMKTLNGHILNKHNMTVDEFKTMYPNQRMHMDTRERGSYKCDICGRVFELKNALASHKRYAHGVVKKEQETKKEGIECKICGFVTTQLSQHLKLKHSMSFEDYCSEYDYNGPKAYFSDEHKKSLSTNKKKFYDSERGIEQKKKQSDLYSGDNNPSKSTEVRKKISESAILRARNEEHWSFYNHSYGIKVMFYWNGIRYSTRSLEEYKCLYTLLKNGINFQYEKTQVNYKQGETLRTYLLDLEIDGVYIEVKGGSRKNIERWNNKEKYKCIRHKIESLDKEFHIFNYDMLCEYLGIEKIRDFEFYVILKNMLDRDECKMSQSLKPGQKPRTIKKIDNDCENNQNIVIYYKGED